jgi:hypothetical protein
MDGGAKKVTGLVSVVIDSVQAGPVHVRDWAAASAPQFDYFDAFKSALEMWRYVKAYDPRQTMKPETLKAEIGI